MGMKLVVAEGGWEHEFPAKRVEVRFALDISPACRRDLTIGDFKQIGVRHGSGWRQAYRLEAEDLLESLVHGNLDLIDNPEEYGLAVIEGDVPNWKHSPGGVSLV